MASLLTAPMLAALKAELADDPAARGYAGQTAAQQAALVNAPFTGTAPAAVAVDVAASAVEQIVVPTGELFAINQLAGKPLSGTVPATGQDAAIAAAWSFAQMLGRWAIIQTSQPATWSAAQAAMAGLLAAGVLSAPSIAAIGALVTPAPPAPVTPMHPRAMDVFMNIAGAPNVVDADDIAAALAS